MQATHTVIEYNIYIEHLLCQQKFCTYILPSFMKNINGFLFLSMYVRTKLLADETRLEPIRMYMPI
jgi:hypothetical protein